MSELLLRSIVEKLESLELAWRASGGVETGQFKEELILVVRELKNMPGQITPINVKLAGLSASINNLEESLLRSAETRIEHRHVLHKGVLIASLLFLIVIGLSLLLFNAYKSRDQYAANDIKYRYCKVTGNRNLLKLCYGADSLYKKDPVSFINAVESEEQRLIQQAEYLRLAIEKEREAKALRQRAGK